MNQRDIYKLVQNLAAQVFKNELDMLRSLAKDIVDHKEFEITGGRVWELNPNDKSYTLRFQYGNVSLIPEDYTMSIENHPLMGKLTQQRAFLNYETDELLKEKGIEIYSIAGVGELVRVGKEKYYRYALAFNAPQILQFFYETLNIIASVATVALHDMASQMRQEKMHTALRQASEIQRSLLPEHSIDFHDFEIYGVCLPDSEVGGDYFDYIRVADSFDERLGIVISDAASKGLPAAIQALFVSGALRMGMNFSPRIGQLFSRLNNLIFDTFPYERFVTLFYCELTMSENRMVLYANAGHCSPVHYRSETDTFRRLDPTGGFLGLMEQQNFSVENIRMHSGDVLLLYTDGINEAQNSSGEFYGEDRICELIRQHCKRSPQEIALKVLEDVQHFCANSTYNDDKTLVVIKRKPPVAG